MIYILIFLGKVVEVTLMTLRVVLITKGEKKAGSVVAFFEVSLWLIIVSSVLTNIAEDPFKILVYSLGFTIGNYTGSLLESYIGIGTSQIQVILRQENGEALRQALYDDGYACTIVNGEGKNRPRHILYVLVPRRRVKAIVEKVKSFQDDAVISVHDTKPYHGGYGLKK